jgi:hypothetical protein
MFGTVRCAGICGASYSVRVYRFKFFNSRVRARFCSRFQVQPNLSPSHSFHTPTRFNVNIIQGLTPFRSTPIFLYCPCKARALSSSPSRLTTSYCRQNLQDDFQALLVCLVALCTVFKNLSPTQDPRGRFL